MSTAVVEGCKLEPVPVLELSNTNTPLHTGSRKDVISSSYILFVGYGANNVTLPLPYRIYLAIPNPSTWRVWVSSGSLHLSRLKFGQQISPGDTEL